MHENKAKDIGDVRPSSLKHIIGQRQIVETVATTLDYCFNEQVPFPNTLLLGPAGLGKTQVARIISDELVCGFHELLSSCIKSPSEFYAVLMSAKRGDVVFLDEIDCLHKSLQTALLIATDERRIYIPNGNNGVPHSIKLEPFSLIGATTEEYGILRPLAQRFKLTLRYQFYSITELVEIVRHRSKGLGWPVDESVLVPIAERSKGVPRNALRLLQSCWRICRATDGNTITTEHLQTACRLEGLDQIGLDYNEQRLLALLERGGVRLNVISTLLGLPGKTVSTVTESFLQRSGLITKDRHGLRHLTEEGRQHLEKNRAKAV